MSLADELAKLDALHAKGALGDAEFQRAKAHLLDAATASAPAVEAVNSLRRSKGDRWIAGVCGGLARATGLESWAWRLIFTVLLLIGGTGALLYLLLWIFVPSE
jgi:phage shock protein PspC (stress-responsive transcriptional regulator)